MRSVLVTEQREAVLQRFPFEHSYHVPLHLGYHLGLRLGEAFALSWEDVDFERQTISVRKQVQWSQEEGCWMFSDPKYDSFRTISVDPALLILLKKEHGRQQRGREYYGERYRQVCVNEKRQLGSKGTPIWLVNTREDGTYIQPRVTQHLNRMIHTQLNMPQFDFHTLRHTHATMLLEAGVNPIDIQERLGHAKVSMTWRYAHNTPAIREQTTTLLAGLFS
ncbi:MAG: site-specific integrase [Candidatus Limiplasma sp.]|nr:site-specific integrase [Candidatus Limiplasma sp.]